MGIYTISCPSCKRAHEWFSGCPDQRCYECKYKASLNQLATSPPPKTPVEGEINKLVGWAAPPPTLRYGIKERLREADASNAAKQDKINSLTEVNDDHRKLNGELREELKVAEEERDLARERANGWRNELDQQAIILNTYIKHAERQLKKIEELENTVQVNSDFIELQGKRLINARNHLARVRQAVDVYEPEDNGPSLDP